ncbi:hypothetical protein VFPFJ_09442 [Purpureocillium lilacinum]|uniref:Uncharacterized protein n=1 Tax=Purpureocillium lilacinum TaxID=33203 RepID=A0A179GU48_PURLI|nr:hypothetical protein VFPFJ_09442 [Purpureocillium lilacinum]OAQ80988.1 hypothetical protein VFPFJ_09442 [Purpureocillium lilacinum]
MAAAAAARERASALGGFGRGGARAWQGPAWLATKTVGYGSTSSSRSRTKEYIRSSSSSSSRERRRCRDGAGSAQDRAGTRHGPCAVLAADRDLGTWAYLVSATCQTGKLEEP